MHCQVKEMTSMEEEKLMSKMRYLIESVPKKILKTGSKAQAEIFFMKKKSRKAYLIQTGNIYKNMDLR